MSDGPGHLVCEHGHQRRVCPHCELAAAYETIARCDAFERQLTSAVARLTRERDEARAELEITRARHSKELDNCLLELAHRRAVVDRETVRAARAEIERDAARTVVEDVDAALDHGIDDADDGLWPCGSSRGEAIRKLRAEVERLRAEGHHD